MSIGLVGAAYVAAAILFILALGGLSNQESAKRAIWYGVVGMGLAVLATVFGPGVGNLWLVVLMRVGYLAAAVTLCIMLWTSETSGISTAIASRNGCISGFNR